jgi:hypothetical protein
MTTVSTSFTAVAASAVLDVPSKGETISVAISGTYACSIRLERDLGRDGLAWETVAGPWTTADATVAEDYVQIRAGERYRLNCYEFTSGTAVTTVSDGDLETSSLVDDVGTTQVTYTQAGATFAGTVTVQGAFEAEAWAAPVDVTAATVTLSPAVHGNRTTTLNRAGGVAVTLPAATGTGNFYKLFVGTTFTSDATITAAGSDVINGGVTVATDTAGLVIPAAVTDTVITMNGTTSGGVVGGWVTLTDVASAVWHVEGFLNSTGVEITPFS